MKFKKVDCPICKNKKFKLISKKGQFDIPIFVSACKKWGLVMLNPRWSQKSYDNFYANEYDSHYRESFGHESNDNAMHILKRISSCLKNKKTLLDIGAGSGYISKYIRDKLNIERVDAIEASREAKKALKLNDINLVSKFLEEYDITKKYDIIILRYVFEHLLDLNKNLKNLKKLLSTNGIIYLSVPCIENPSMSIKKYFLGQFIHFIFLKKI